MTAAPAPSAPSRPRLALKENLLLVDVAALALAFASFVIYVAFRTIAFEPDEVTLLRYVDYAAIVLFALFFVGKGLVSENPARYARTHFFDVFGLLPITSPLFGFDRWWGFVGVLIVLARASAALDRAFGERVLARVMHRYRAALVEELTEPILIRLLTIIREALQQGRYTASMGATLEERRNEMHAVVKRSIEASPKLTFLRNLPGMEHKIDEAVDELVTSAVTALTSDEMNRLVADALARAISDLEKKVAEPTWKGKGLGMLDVAKGLTRRA